MYSSLSELPIDNWRMIFKTGDLKHLTNGNGEKCENLKEHWHKLSNEFIEKIGLTDHFKAAFEIKKKIISLNCKFVRTKDRFLLNEINFQMDKLRQSESGEAADLTLIVSKLEKIYGFEMNPRTTSVIDFYRRLNSLKDG